MSPHPRKPGNPSAIAWPIDSSSILSIRSQSNRPSIR